MGIRCAAIEGMLATASAIVALHPGTTVSNLSQPFTERRNPPPQSAQQCAEEMFELIAGLTPEHNGCFLRLNEAISAIGATTRRGVLGAHRHHDFVFTPEPWCHWLCRAHFTAGAISAGSQRAEQLIFMPVQLAPPAAFIFDHGHGCCWIGDHINNVGSRRGQG